MSDSARADALPAGLPREGRGKLKVFLGAAPGVGKTYAMLQAAHAQQRLGVQVLAGIVETHGRAETEALLGGLAQQPLLRTDYRGVTLEEMDLDGLLKAAPTLALVDELAHTNAPGSRHAKRWQDVQELLAAGIDVYTTVNVQPGKPQRQSPRHHRRSGPRDPAGLGPAGSLRAGADRPPTA